MVMVEPPETMRPLAKSWKAARPSAIGSKPEWAKKLRSS
jgi:hypothetical protein